MTKEEAKRFGLRLLHGIMERNESYPVYANNVKQAIDALSETSGSSEIPKDLEEAACKYHRTHTDEVMDYHGYHNGTTKEVYDVTPGESFIDGAKWQREQDEKEQADLFTIVALDAAQRAKEQIMKEAVEGTYNNSDWGTPCIDLPSPLELERFDKVRIIIVKEDKK